MFYWYFAVKNIDNTDNSNIFNLGLRCFFGCSWDFCGEFNLINPSRYVARSEKFKVSSVRVIYLMFPECGILTIWHYLLTWLTLIFSFWFITLIRFMTLSWHSWRIKDSLLCLSSISPNRLRTNWAVWCDIFS